MKKLNWKAFEKKDALNLRFKGSMKAHYQIYHNGVLFISEKDSIILNILSGLKQKKYNGEK